MSRRNILFVSAVVFTGAVLAASCSSSDSSSSTSPTTASPAGPAALVGLFGVAPGQCAGGGAPTGSYFRMVQSGGTADAGPFVSNGDSTCGDQTFTALTPGSNGGLTTGTYQPQPDPPFDSANRGLAAAIVQPATFFGAPFAVSTNPTDPVNGAAVPAPTVSSEAGKLTGALAAVNVAWNGQQFNQGAPKPDGTLPGISSPPTGKYDPATGAYTLAWSSQIVGGPFNGFTGIWHLEGTFKAS